MYIIMGSGDEPLSYFYTHFTILSYTKLDSIK